jgi:hypothetical protein
MEAPKVVVTQDGVRRTFDHSGWYERTLLAKVRENFKKIIDLYGGHQIIVEERTDDYFDTIGPRVQAISGYAGLIAVFEDIFPKACTLLETREDLMNRDRIINFYSPAFVLNDGKFTDSFLQWEKEIWESHPMSAPTLFNITPPETGQQGWDTVE